VKRLRDAWLVLIGKIRPCVFIFTWDESEDQEMRRYLFGNADRPSFLTELDNVSPEIIKLADEAAKELSERANSDYGRPRTITSGTTCYFGLGICGPPETWTK
jgi:hypothetical protein